MLTKKVAVTGKYDSECHTHVIPGNCGVNQTAMLRVLIIIPAIKVNMNWNCQHAKFRHCVNILNSNWATRQHVSKCSSYYHGLECMNQSAMICYNE